MNFAMNYLLNNCYFITGNSTFGQTTVVSLVSGLAPSI